VKRLADDVSVASRQQAAGIEQVSKAVVELEKSMQAIAGTAEEGAAVSEELSAQSETVMGVVGQLDTLVSGGSSRTERGPRTGSAVPQVSRRYAATLPRAVPMPRSAVSR
jgi:methyl-accepting chemotaxis protein